MMDFDYLFQAWFVYKKYQLVVDIKEKTFLQLSSPPSFIVRVLGRSGGGGGERLGKGGCGYKIFRRNKQQVL